MGIELHPGRLPAPRDLQSPGSTRGDAGRRPEQPAGIAAIQDHLHLWQLSQLARNFTEREVRRANTLIQLMIIFEEKPPHLPDRGV